MNRSVTIFPRVSGSRARELCGSPVPTVRQPPGWRTWDIKIYVDVGEDVRFIRRLQRDVAERGPSMDDVIRR